MPEFLNYEPSSPELTPLNISINSRTSYKDHLSFIEEIIPIREIRFLSFFIVCLGPSFSNCSLHVFVTIFVHLLHHVHQPSAGVFHLLFFFISLKLNYQIFTLLSL